MQKTVRPARFRGEAGMREEMPDVKARITLTGRDFVCSGYRPAHRIGDYLTTGVQEYRNVEMLKRGETAEGVIYFLSPEYYPHSLKCGMKIYFQEGAQITGYVEILEIYNEILRA